MHSMLALVPAKQMSTLLSLYSTNILFHTVILGDAFLLKLIRIFHWNTLILVVL